MNDEGQRRVDLLTLAGMVTLPLALICPPWGICLLAVIVACRLSVVAVYTVGDEVKKQ